MPCAVTGCLNRPASPTSAHPGPVAGRTKPRNIVSGTTTRGETRLAPSSRRGLSTVWNRRRAAR